MRLTERQRRVLEHMTDEPMWDESGDMDGYLPYQTRERLVNAGLIVAAPYRDWSSRSRCWRITEAGREALAEGAPS